MLAPNLTNVRKTIKGKNYRRGVVETRGYKTKVAEKVKKEVGIKAIRYPKHSPDLNPLDFYLWGAIEDKVLKALAKPASVEEFFKKLTRAARTIPTETIKKAVANIRTRARAVVKARGGDISRD